MLVSVVVPALVVDWGGLLAIGTSSVLLVEGIAALEQSGPLLVASAPVVVSPICLAVRMIDITLRLGVLTQLVVQTYRRELAAQSRAAQALGRDRSAKGAGMTLLLARAATPAQERFVGDQAGGWVFLFLSTDDFRRDYQALQGRGVRFVREPKQAEYGTVAVFEDLYGNRWDLVELGPSHPLAGR